MFSATVEEEKKREKNEMREKRKERREGSSVFLKRVLCHHNMEYFYTRSGGNAVRRTGVSKPPERAIAIGARAYHAMINDLKNGKTYCSHGCTGSFSRMIHVEEN